MKTKLHHLIWKIPCVAVAAIVVLAGGVRSGSAANILWVSDASPGAATGGVFSGAGTGLTDSGFVTLLQSAGHNVMRFNPPDSQNTNLTVAELTAINTNDLIIIGRAANSGGWRAPQGAQWNTQIIKPLICMSPYLVRSITGAENRMGWFVGSNPALPDDTPTVLSAVIPIDLATDYLFSGVAMSGTNTASVYDEIMDRNTSHISDPPVTGGRVLSTASFAAESNGGRSNANTIVDIPVATLVRAGADALAGYRMYFAAGSREGSTQPAAIPLYTGRETLTPTGEEIFLRAVQLALNSGVPPATDPAAPMAFTTAPADATVVENGAVTFSATTTGAGPRTLQWQRDIGDGITFTNIPDAGTPFVKTELRLPLVTSADNNAKFILIASNPINAITSSVVTLTVTEDTTPPVPVSAASIDSNTIGVLFSEPLDLESATLAVNYVIASGGLDSFANSATLRPDGRTVVLQAASPVESSFTVVVEFIRDVSLNEMPAAITVNGGSVGLTGVEVGPPNPAGASFATDVNAFEIGGGGTNALGNADQFSFFRRAVTGDFDARVRVRGIVGSDRLESYAKALLAARETDAAGSAGVLVFATTPTPGDNSIGTTIRIASGAQATALGSVVVPGGIPSAWLRITRLGNAFTTYRSTDGTAWTAFGSTNLALSASMLVGVGANSHRGGRLVTATFGNLRIRQLPTITNAGVGTGSFPTENGVTYQVVYKDTIDAPAWTPLPGPAIVGDGNVKSFTDPSPAAAQRFYRIEIP